MHPIEFNGHNTFFAKNQREYLPLPAFRYPNDNTGKVLFCWKLSWKERLKVLISGKLWHTVLTFNEPLQPQLLVDTKPEINAQTKNQI